MTDPEPSCAMEFLNLEYRALLKESGILTGGIRYGIKTLCQDLHSKELLVEDIYKLSLGNADDLSLPEKVVYSLMERVKNDRMAFKKIVEVLHETIGMEHLAKRLEEWLASLQKEYAQSLANAEHARNVANAQLEQARKREYDHRCMQLLNREGDKMKTADLVAPSGTPFNIHHRPTTISASRDAHTSLRNSPMFSTGLAHGMQSRPFTDLHSGGTLSAGSTENRSMATMTSTPPGRPIDKTHRRAVSRDQIETGMKYFQPPTSTARSPVPVPHPSSSSPTLGSMKWTPPSYRPATQPLSTVTPTDQKPLGQYTPSGQANRLGQSPSFSSSHISGHRSSGQRGSSEQSQSGPHLSSVQSLPLGQKSSSKHTLFPRHSSPSGLGLPSGHGQLYGQTQPQPPSVTRQSNTTGQSSTTGQSNTTGQFNTTGQSNITGQFNTTGQTQPMKQVDIQEKHSSRQGADKVHFHSMSHGNHTTHHTTDNGSGEAAIPPETDKNNDIANGDQRLKENEEHLSLQREPEQHKCVPESVPPSKLTKQKSLLHGNRPIHNHSQSDSERYTTPPSTPSSPMRSLTNSLNGNSKKCTRCSKLKTQLSQCESELNTLKLSHENLQADYKVLHHSHENLKVASMQQNDHLRQELNQSSQMHYQAEIRHSKQVEIIASLQREIRKLQQEVCYGDCERVKELREELNQELEGRERERQEKERFRVKRDKALEESSKVKRENRELKEKNMQLEDSNYQLENRNRELEERLRVLYRQCHRANSLQCDWFDGSDEYAREGQQDGGMDVASDWEQQHHQQQLHVAQQLQQQQQQQQQHGIQHEQQQQILQQHELNQEQHLQQHYQQHASQQQQQHQQQQHYQQHASQQLQQHQQHGYQQLQQKEQLQQQFLHQQQQLEQQQQELQQQLQPEQQLQRDFSGLSFTTPPIDTPAVSGHALQHSTTNHEYISGHAQYSSGNHGDSENEPRSRTHPSASEPDVLFASPRMHSTIQKSNTNDQF